MRLQIIFSILIMVVISSCSDFFEQTVAIELPPHNSVLAVTSKITDSDSISVAFLSETRSTLDNSDLKIIDNAEVKFEVDDRPPIILEYDGRQTFFEEGYYLGERLGLDENFNRVSITIEAPGYPKIMAEQNGITKVEIETLNVELGSDQAGSFTDNKFEVTFTDPAEEENYYTIKAFLLVVSDNQNYINELYIESTDPLIVTENQEDDNLLGIIFNDRAINGKRYTVKFENDDYFTDPDLEDISVLVQLISMSKDSYLYNQTFAAYNRAKDNPFAEPVVIHSNVQGGSGIFTVDMLDEELFEF